MKPKMNYDTFWCSASEAREMFITLDLSHGND
jgi:hypothetical protein